MIVDTVKVVPWTEIDYLKVLKVFRWIRKVIVEIQKVIKIFHIGIVGKKEKIFITGFLNTVMKVFLC